MSDSLVFPMEGLFVRTMPLWKRAMDVTGACVGIVVLGPVMIAIAIAIKLTSAGPVIFEQPRVGIGRIPFRFFKFRSMCVDAESRMDALQSMNERSGPAFKMENDPRVTSVGRFIRRWSLDELPQLFNVLKGDMSLVGPRPLILREADAVSLWHRKRFDVLPGLTCLWQVFARGEEDYDRRIRLDIQYVNEQSLWLDLKLILLTIPVVLSQKGAC